MSTQSLLCSRCQNAPRLPRQRWCRQCLTSAQRERRSTARQAAQVDDAITPVTHAPIQAMLSGPPAPVPGFPEAQRQAIEAYQHAVHEYQVRRQPRQGWMPQDRSSILVPLWQKVEEAKRRCIARGIDLERDR